MPVLCRIVVEPARQVGAVLVGEELAAQCALATIERDDFGIDAGKAYGFDMTVTLRIQVEALHDA
ncbi:MAG: hypothetical protein ACREO4_03655 [Lysobacter sp.]